MYTSTVMFETTETQLREAEEERLAQLAGHDDDDSKQQANIRRKRVLDKMRNNKKTVASLAIGGTAAVVAVGVMSFGDVQATLDNVPILGGGGDIEMDIDACCEDCDACDCDADCDCDCIVM